MNARQWRLLALALLLGAVGTAAYGVSQGWIGFTLLLIIPVFYGTGPFLLLPMALLLGAFAAYAAGSMAAFRESGADHPAWAPRADEERVDRSTRGAASREAWEEPNRQTKWGGVVMLGPLPIAFGNDRRMLAVLMGLAIALVIVVLLLPVLLAALAAGG